MIPHLTTKNIVYYGTGGTDMEGEWHWSGDYYAYIANADHNLRHNYEVKYMRVHKRNRWRVVVYICLTCCNSAEYTLHNAVYDSLCKAKQGAVDFILEWDGGTGFENEIMPQVLAKQMPVFAVSDADIRLVGACYRSLSSDIMERHLNRWKYYQPDFPDYNTIHENRFYMLDRKMRVQYTERGFYGYCSGWLKEEEEVEVIPKLLVLIKDDSRFVKYFEPTHELEG